MIWTLLLGDTDIKFVVISELFSCKDQILLYLAVSSFLLGRNLNKNDIFKNSYADCLSSTDCAFEATHVK